MSTENQQTDRVEATKESSAPQMRPFVPVWKQSTELDQDVQFLVEPPLPGEQVSQEESTPTVDVQPQKDEVDATGYVLEDWLTELVALTVQGRQQMDRVEARLESLTRCPERLDRRLIEAMAETVALRDAMEGLQKEMKRIGRHQFKANALDETRIERWKDAVETLESALARREGEIASIRLQQRQAVEAARQEWLSALLPVLDGLEDALAAGRVQVDRLEDRYDEWKREQRRRRGLFARLRRSWSRAVDSPDYDALAALDAWLDGLRLLRDRMWTLLEEEGVRVIPTVGYPFNPHLHVAISTVERSDVTTGSVIEERRRGYRLGDRVIRFAQVVVVRSPSAHETEQEKELSIEE